MRNVTASYTRHGVGSTSALRRQTESKGNFQLISFEKRDSFPAGWRRRRLFAEFRSSVIDFSTAMNAVAVKMADALECRCTKAVPPSDAILSAGLYRECFYSDGALMSAPALASAAADTLRLYYCSTR